MGPICGVYFKLSVATKRVCVRQAVQEMFTSSTQKPAAAVFCNKWIPVGHVSQGNTQKQCLYAIAPSQQLMQPALSRKALLYNTHSTGGIWIVLIQYRQARSDGSFRAMCTLYGAIQSSKICRQHQITKREHWLCSGTICYQNLSFASGNVAGGWRRWGRVHVTTRSWDSFKKWKRIQ